MTDMSPETVREAPRSHIGFFLKKQMSLTEDGYESRNTTRGPQESHLLFLEKANVTHRSQMTDMSPETIEEAPGVTFAFSGKSKCHSLMTDMSPGTLPEAPRSHICFSRENYMPLPDDRYESRNTGRGPAEVTFAFSGKSKCHL